MGRIKDSIVLFLFLSVCGVSVARDKAAACYQEEKAVNLYHYLCTKAFDAYIKEDHTLAFEYYKKAFQVYPYDGEAPFRLASYYRSLNNIPKALEMAKRAVDADSLNLNSYALLSVMYFDSHMTDQTLQVLESAVRIAWSTEEKIRFLNMIYNVHSRKSDFLKMLETLGRVEELEGETTDGLMQQATIYGTIGNLESARKCVQRLIELDPSAADESLTMLAESYWNHNMDKEALDIYKTILDRFPHSLNGRLSMVDFYSARHNDEKLTETLISLVTDVTIDKEIRSSLLESVLAMHKTLLTGGRAACYIKQIFNSYFKYEPDDINNMNDFVYTMCLIDSADLDYYFLLSEKTIKAEPQNAVFLDTYAWVAYLSGKYAVARKYIDLALEYSGNMNNVEMFDHAGDIYLKSGLKSRACEFWTKAMNILIDYNSNGINNTTIDTLQQKIRNNRK